MEETIERVSPDLQQKLESIAREVGHTPLRAFTGLAENPAVKIYAKEEWQQISGSVKARAAYAIIRQAIRTGELRGDKILLDATSGNTGIAYAAIAKRLGIRVLLCLPENASRERKEILHALGAELVLTSRFEGTDGAQKEARRLFRENPGLYFYADQYRNAYNWRAHYHNGTADEIYTELPSLTHFVAALGSTGTLVGAGRRFRELNPDIRLVALQPDTPMHGMEGWKHLETAIVPGIYDAAVAHETVTVSPDEAYAMIRTVRDREGLVLSPSSAGNLVGAVKVANRLSEGVVVTVLPDNADKYSDIIKKLNG